MEKGTGKITVEIWEGSILFVLGEPVDEFALSPETATEFAETILKRVAEIQTQEVPARPQC